MLKRFCRWLFQYPRRKHFVTVDHLRSIHRKLDIIMTNQEKVDSIADFLTTATANIRQDIADLKAANPVIDFSKLEASVAGIGDLDLENPPASVAKPK